MFLLTVLKTFAQECFDDDLGLTLTFLARKFAFYTFILQELMELVEEFCGKVNNTIK